MTVHTIKITRPDSQETELMWKLYHAADAVENRWGGGWSVQDITRELQRTELDRDQRRFFMRAWQVLVVECGGFGRFISAFDTYVHNMQDPADDCVAWKPELQKVFNDVELMAVVLEGYEEARQKMSTQGKSVVPEGWQMVPKKATQAMLDAVVIDYHGTLDIGYELRKAVEEDYQNAYQTALSSAPKLNTQQQEGTK